MHAVGSQAQFGELLAGSVIKQYPTTHAAVHVYAGCRHLRIFSVSADSSK